MSERDVSKLLSERIPATGLELLRRLGEIADERGTSAYVVGGLVRDLLLDVPNYDLDVVVEEDAIAYAEAAASALGGSVKAHTRFGTVILVLPGGRKVDLATSRSEVYEHPGALPTVTPGSIENDLRRRDFTINSMAVKINTGGFGTLLDYFEGESDLLEKHVLRVLTDRSFEDDPTRVLRGVRFGARFELTFEPDTEALLKKAVSERRADTVSGERLMNELVLILTETDAGPPVSRLVEWGILESIHESWSLVPAVTETLARLDRLAQTDDSAKGSESDEHWRTRLLALLEPLAPDTRTEVLERLAAGRKLRGLVRELASFEADVLPALSAGDELSPSALFRLLAAFSPPTLLVERAVRPGTPEADRLAFYTSSLAGTSTVLGGGDIAALGIGEGAEVGKVLNALLDARLDGAISTVEEEREFASLLVRTLTQGTRTDSVSGQSEPSETSQEHPVVPNEDLTEATEASDPTAAPRPADEREPSMVNRPVYEVRLETFEGPLDLLLHLIREHEIDIYDIPIATITEQYLEYIDFMESLDLALAGEFLEMAATLIRIKVQMLLPKETDGEEEEEDPREQLVRKLVEYRKFKEAAGALSGMEEDRRKYFARGVDPRSYAELEEDVMDIDEFMRDVTLFDLVDGLREVLSRVPDRIEAHSVDMEEVTVEQQMEHIREVVAEQGSMSFMDLFKRSATRFEVIATFIALLELIRLGAVKAVQKRNFDSIEVVARVEE